MQHICSGVKGVVKSLQHDRSYGFIREKDTGREVFFHISGLVLDQCHRCCREAWTCQDRPIRVGDEVKYELYLAPKGYRAESVRVLNVEPVLGDFNPDQFHDDILYDDYDWSRGSTGPTSNHRVSGAGPQRGRGQRQNGQGSGDLKGIIIKTLHLTNKCLHFKFIFKNTCKTVVSLFHMIDMDMYVSCKHYFHTLYPPPSISILSLSRLITSVLQMFV